MAVQRLIQSFVIISSAIYLLLSPCAVLAATQKSSDDFIQNFDPSQKMSLGTGNNSSPTKNRVPKEGSPEKEPVPEATKAYNDIVATCKITGCNVEEEFQRYQQTGFWLHPETAQPKKYYTFTGDVYQRWKNWQTNSNSHKDSYSWYNPLSWSWQKNPARNGVKNAIKKTKEIAKSVNKGVTEAWKQTGFLFQAFMNGTLNMSTNSYSPIHYGVGSGNSGIKPKSSQLKVMYSSDPTVKKVEQQLITGIQNTDHNKLQEVRNNTNNGTANFTLSQRGEFQKWITKTVQENKKILQADTSTRLFINATYINTLEDDVASGKKSYLDMYAGGADFIALSWDNTAQGKYNFHKDFSVYFARRQGTECLWTTVGCIRESTPNKGIYSNYVINKVGFKSGFSTIFDDSKHGDGGNIMYHTTGLVNFGVADDTVCGPVVQGTSPQPPYITCLPPEGWVMMHETYQHGEKKLFNDDRGESWEDAIVGIEAVQLGRDFRNGKIPVEKMGQEIRNRLGEKKHNICKEYVSKMPTSQFWDTVTCADIPDYLKNSK